MTDLSAESRPPAELSVPPQAAPVSAIVTIESRVSHHMAIGLLCAVVLVAAACLQLHGSDHVRLPGGSHPLPDVCTYRRWTGKPCPGCGLTRSFIAMAHGDWKRAWQFHPFGALLFAYCGCQVAFRGMQIMRLRRGLAPWQIGRWHDVMVFVYLGAFVVFAICRLLAQWMLG